MGVVNNEIRIAGIEANTAGIMTSISSFATSIGALESSTGALETAVASGYILLPDLHEVTYTEETTGTVENALSNFMADVASISLTMADDEVVLFTDFVIDGFEMKPCGESAKIVNKTNLQAYLNALRVGGFAKIVLDGTKVQIITAMARLSISSGYYIVQTVSSDSTQNAVVKHAPTDSLSGGKTFKCHYYKLKKYSFD